MRGRQAMAVAVRHPSGEIVVHGEPLQRGFYGSPWAKRPFIRGALLLWDTLVLGTRALVYSASVAMEETRKRRRRTTRHGAAVERQAQPDTAERRSQRPQRDAVRARRSPRPPPRRPSGARCCGG